MDAPAGSGARRRPARGRPRRLRLALGLGFILALAGPAAHAEPLPAASLGLLFGASTGTGAYKHELGLGYYQFGGQAAWQPMTTERRVGWSLKWSFVFGTMSYADAARIDPYLRTLQMDFMGGLRFRPGSSVRRYLALRGGVELFRSNAVIAPANQRAFVGPVAAAALEQYAFGALLFNVDVRYGLIGSGPSEVAVLAGASISVR
jgi:hypothetical protein